MARSRASSSSPVKIACPSSNETSADRIPSQLPTVAAMLAAQAVGRGEEELPVAVAAIRLEEERGQADAEGGEPEALEAVDVAAGLLRSHEPSQSSGTSVVTSCGLERANTDRRPSCGQP